MQPAQHDGSALGPVDVTGDWYDELNKDTTIHSRQLDDDPPYFISSNGDPLTSQWGNNSRRGYGAAKTGSGNTDEEESFRSVIDDLTIKNQKLKKRLRRFENIHGGSEDSEKMFEVRFHGLPSDKKLELDNLLQQFASTLGPVKDGRECSGSDPSSLSGSRSKSTPPARIAADSTYSSMTSLLQTSAESKVTRIKERDNKRPRTGSSLIESNERYKMRTIIRRLEQLFIGGSVNKDRSKIILKPPSQKSSDGQSISTDASGAREAQLMTREETDQVETKGTILLPDKTVLDSGVSSPHQRATRPSDFLRQANNLHPSSSVDYLHHLSAANPETLPHTAGHQTGDETGWVYLNLLINFAQLHNLNVTPELVRKAIHTMSSHIELSEDGAKARWKGGVVASELRGSTTEDSESVPTDADESSSSGGEKTSIDPSSGPNLSAEYLPAQTETPGKPKLSKGSRKAQRLNSPRETPFHYKPIFFRKKDSRSATDSDSMADSDSGGNMTSPDKPGSGDKSRRRKEIEEGPVIYYPSATFCTDLSAQQFPDGELPQCSTSDIKFERFGKGAIGLSDGRLLDELSDSTSSVQDIDESSFDPSSFSFAVRFPSREVPSIGSPPMDFAASGLGGVQPFDNFCTEVTVRYPIKRPRAPSSTSSRKSRSSASSPHVHKRILNHRIPVSALHAFFSDSPDASPSPLPFAHTVLSATTHHLEPSSLPPAGYYFAEYSSDSSEAESDLLATDEDSRMMWSSSSPSLNGDAAHSSIGMCGVLPPSSDADVSLDEDEANDEESLVEL